MLKIKCKNLLPLALASSFALTTANATQVQFTVEPDQMILNGNPISDKAERDANNIEALGFFVNDAVFSSFTGNELWSGLDTSISTDAYSNVLSVLNESGLGSSSSINPVPDTVPVSNLFQGAVDSGSAGNHAVLVLHDGGAGNVENLTVGNSFGVVTTTFETLEQGTTAVGFTKSNSWDTFLLGNSGSIQMASVVPEPSAFALLAGCLGLAWVMVRRRA